MVKRKTPDTLTVAEVKEELHYDPLTGDWTWLENTRLAGKKAGYTAKSDGYVRIWLKGKRYLAHRLAWFYMTGEWPIEIDHKDRNRSNNEFGNLRNVTTSENHRNMPMSPRNTSGVNGISYCKRDKLWVAYCNYNGEIHRKSGKSYDEIFAWRIAKEREFGYDPTHGLEEKQK